MITYAILVDDSEEAALVEKSNEFFSEMINDGYDLAAEFKANCIVEARAYFADYIENHLVPSA